MPKKAIWNTPDPNKHPKHMSSAMKSSAKRWAKNHHIPYPSLTANLHAMKHKAPNMHASRHKK